MEWNDYLTGVFLALGSFLALTGGVGILRMPDFYSRLHPAGKTDSLGQLMVLIGLCFQTSDWLVLAKLGLIVSFLMLTAPTATHAITKAAWLEGLRPWQRPGDAENVYTRKHPDKRAPYFSAAPKDPLASSTSAEQGQQLEASDE
ncbi:MAG: monovalent cation/H(+) antiporter subunit G [Planctomycetota bacterium]|nr:monovalent cation/H(+) antiporter subunit G [Planctomycetota bacterium]